MLHSPHHPLSAFFTALLLASSPALAAEGRNLFDRLPLADQVTTHDATITVAPDAIRVATGHREPWPGITLTPPGGQWDLSRDAAIAAEIRNTGKENVTVSMRVDNAGADGTKNCVTRQVTIPPGETKTLRTPLGRTDIKLFGMRGYPPETYVGIDPAHVTQILFFVNRPTADHQWQLAMPRLEPTEERPGPFFPLIDTFGQYMHRDWPGKTHSLDELHQRRDQEAAELAAHPGPADWDRYGGFNNGPTLRASGYFRTEQHAGKWWLIDPDGHLFFSQGIDCVLELDATPTDERQDWFQDFPGDRPEFAAFLSQPFALHGHYAGKDPRSFSFAAANHLRKYGPDWRRIAADLAHQRLRSWGLNTIGNWSDAAVYRLHKTPYVTTLSTTGQQATMIAGSTGYWGKFPDPFAPDFAAGIARRAAQQARQTADDPWCLGYFVDNEMSWGDELSLALATLQSPADQPAKKVFLDDLRAKYQTIAALNAAWGAKHASWEALAAAREPPDKTRARTDLEAFYTQTAEAYFAAVKKALTGAAPHQLYLGCRFAGSNPLAVRAAAKFCDVVSFNIYQHDVKSLQLPQGVDRPVIIGEFHFGALDRGMLHTGLVPTENQAARASAYRAYVQSALRHPNVVGCHWFKYCDEPTTGRAYDEENYQIGFVDVVDTPYPETISAARQLATTVYPYRLAAQ